MSRSIGLIGWGIYLGRINTPLCYPFNHVVTGASVYHVLRNDTGPAVWGCGGNSNLNMPTRAYFQRVSLHAGSFHALCEAGVVRH